VTQREGIKGGNNESEGPETQKNSKRGGKAKSITSGSSRIEGGKELKGVRRGY